MEGAPAHGAAPVYEELPYIPYAVGRADQPAFSNVVYFRRTDGQDLLLSDALGQQCEGLVGADLPALPEDVSAKITLRLQYEGYASYTRQIMARRSTSGGEPISLRVLARKIAQEMAQFITTTHRKGAPFRYCGVEISTSNLLLNRLVRESTGSWCPVFKVMV